jgi:hypothetical protein
MPSDLPASSDHCRGLPLGANEELLAMPDASRSLPQTSAGVWHKANDRTRPTRQGAIILVGTAR